MTAASQLAEPPHRAAPSRTTAVRVTEKAADIDHLDLALEERSLAGRKPGQVVIEIAAAGVNPSDVKAVLGAMPHAVWPRTPGRDYAGVVVDGPAELLGQEVWGSGGELGIRRDGSHARHLLLDAAHVRAKPAGDLAARGGRGGRALHHRLRGPARGRRRQAPATSSSCSAPTARSARPRSSSRPWRAPRCSAWSARRRPTSGMRAARSR